MRFTNKRGGCLYDPKGQRKYLTPSERERFLTVAKACTRGDVRSFCLVLGYTGCRISEALALTASSIEAAEGFVSIRCLKKRRGEIAYREVPIPPDLIAALACVLGDRERRLWTFSRGRAWQLVKSIMATAGIGTGPHASPKGLRHGFGLHAIRCGVPLNLVQRWLGHASIATTSIYLQAMGNEEREIAARMW